MLNSEDGVWRTVGGRRIFIKEGQSLSDAMIQSNKFKKQDSKELTQEEINAVEDYVMLGNEEISEERAKLLEKVIDENAKFDNGTLYRHATTPEFGMRLSEIKANPQELEGKIITSKGFLSTSSREGGTENFFAGLEIKFNKIKNTKGLEINKLKGLSPYSATRRQYEREVLFNKGTKYKITNVNLLRDNSGEIYDVKLEADIIGK